jgi:Ca2+/Na+ antiporter
MLSLYVALVLLGLAAIDPIGLAIMPVLLQQKNPYKRSFIFLGGSFASLMVMGLLFAKGFGEIILHFDKTYSHLVPSLEIAAGVILLIIAAYVFWRSRAGKLQIKPSLSILKRLRLNNRQLFSAGMILVAIQSIADVVFVVAMIRIGRLNLSFATLLLAVLIYALAALILQLIIIAAYRLSPSHQRTAMLDKVHLLLTKYANQAIMVVSLILGCGLLIVAA